MKIAVDIGSLKPAALQRLALMLAPGGEPLSPRLAAFLQDLQTDLDAVMAAGGAGTFDVELASLSDEDVGHLSLRWYAVEAALDPAKDVPFMAFLAQLRVAVANERILREVAAGTLLLAGPPPDDDDVVES